MGKVSIAKSILHYFFLIFTPLVLAGLIQAGLTSRINHGVPFAWNHSVIYVATDSMVSDKPDALAVGTGIVIERAPATSLSIGDIITFYDENISAMNTHRIIEIHEKDGILHFKTRADNVSSALHLYDGESFDQSHYIGKVVFSSPLLGKLLSAFSLQASAMSCVNDPGSGMLYIYFFILPMLIVFLFSLGKLFFDIKHFIQQDEKDFEEYLRNRGLENATSKQKDRFKKEFEKDAERKEAREEERKQSGKLGLAICLR